MIRIRKATSEDRSVVFGFHLALYRDHQGSIATPELAELSAYRDFERVLRQDVDALLMQGGALVLLAEEDGQAIGYASGRVEDQPRRLLPRRGVVEDWYVDPTARGRGVGRLLFEGLTDHFRESGCDVVESGTWAYNTGARHAHEALGFSEIEIKYRKRLNAT